MKNKKLFNLLRLLSKEELVRFGEYIYSPFFNKNQKAVLLWDLLKDYAPNFNHPELKDYGTYNHIYDKPVSIETVFRFTTRLLEDYLVQIRQREDHYYKKFLLLDELIRLESWRDFSSQYKAVSGRLRMEKRRGAQFFYLKFLIELIQLDFLQIDGAVKEELAEHIEGTVENLDIFYLISKVNLSAHLAFLKNQPKLDGILLQTLEEQLQNGWLKDAPAAQLQYLVLCCASRGEVKDFIAIINLEDKIESAVPRKDLQVAYLHAAHFCLLKSQEQKKYVECLFALCELVLQKKLFPPYQNQGTAWIHHLVNAGKQLKANKETRELLLRFKSQLPVESRDFDYHFFMGLTYYQEGKLSESTKHFKSGRSFKTVLGIEAHAFLLRIFYSQNLSDLGQSLKEFSLRVVRAKPLIKEERESYLQFSKLLAALVKMKEKDNTTTKMELTAKAHDCPSQHQEWLLEVIKLA